MEAQLGGASEPKEENEEAESKNEESKWKRREQAEAEGALRSGGLKRRPLGLFCRSLWRNGREWRLEWQRMELGVGWQNVTNAFRLGFLALARLCRRVPRRRGDSRKAPSRMEAQVGGLLSIRKKREKKS